MCYGGNDQYVVFADVINKVARSTGKVVVIPFRKAYSDYEISVDNLDTSAKHRDHYSRKS